MTKEIHQRVTIRAAPSKVFEALIDEKKHAAFTGAPTKIHRKVGGTFSCFGGYLNGITLELEPAKRIVQAWRSRNWPKGTYSIVTFNFIKAAKGQTRLEFTQVGVPSGDFKQKSSGWRKRYWQPLKRFLEIKKKQKI